MVSRFEYYYRYVFAPFHEVFSPFNGMNSSFHQRQSIKRSKESGKPHSVLPSLIKCFGPVLVASAIFRVVCDTLMMVTPQIMKRMISHVTLDEIGAEGVYPWQGKVFHEKDLFRDIAYHAFPQFPFPGYFYAALMFIALSARTILEAQYYGIKTYNTQVIRKTRFLCSTKSVCSRWP